MTLRVVVAGYGMAAARFVAAIRDRDPGGSRVALTVLAAERHGAYNRILLSSVVGGRMGPADVRLHEDGWEEAHEVRLTHRTAVALHRNRRAVECEDGEAIGYDALVLATGSRPSTPAVAGLRGPDGALAPGVVCFRTLDDCRAVLAAAATGGPVIVLGGGLLGVEAARGLAAQGAAMTIVQRPGQLMDRQLDRGAARILERWMRGLGIGVLLGAHAARWAPGEGLFLADGTGVPGTPLVVAAGVVAATGLAAASGLRRDRGVLVDDQLRTSDPRIHAIGDCAQHPRAQAGLGQPAWDQADVLAGLLSGADPAASYGGTATVTRLRADAIELATAGEPLAGQDDESPGETLRFEDPARGGYARLTLRNDRIAGAVMLGLPDAAARVIQLFDRGAPAPSDRLTMLLGRALPAETAPGTAATPSPTWPPGCPPGTPAVHARSKRRP
jgi:assimilatory nitrate reductase electron transfer subunit